MQSRQSRSSEFAFPNGAGQRLAANLELPAGEPRAFALFAHCFTCSRNVHAATRLSRALGGHGFGVLRFDFTGLGSSEGDFSNTNFSSNVDDLVAAAEALRGSYRAPALLVGHSLGGAAVLAAAQRIPEVRAVVTVAAPSDTGHVLGLLGSSLEAIERDGEARVKLAGREFTIQRQFVADVSQTRLAEAVGGLGRALLVLHSPNDELVGIDHARRLFEAARHPKSFVALDGADHLLTRPRDAEFAAAVIAAWAARYLDAAEGAPQGTGDRAGAGAGAGTPAPEPSEPGVVRVEETAPGPFSNRVTAGAHAFLADEPLSVGGADLGPGPYDLLLAGLGACTSMTLRMYADRKGWPLEHVAVRLTHARVHAEDCAGCEEDGAPIARIDRIERIVELSGPLTDEQRGRLLEIAERCPVHRTLLGPKEIPTRLAPQTPA